MEGSLSDPRWGRCRVATAAAQEGICQPGEQLLVIPLTFILMLSIVLVVHCVAYDTLNVMSLLAVIAQRAMPTILLLILPVILV